MADIVAKIFPLLAWAAYVQPNRNPPKGHEPVAYIIVLINKDIEMPGFGKVDAAAAIENILLVAWSKGIGSCWLGSVERDKMMEILDIPSRLEIDSVIALGYPDEQPVSEDVRNDSEEPPKYYLDNKDILHVPKRTITTIGHFNGYGWH